MTIAEWLERGMEEKGIRTQNDLAIRAGVSAVTISLGKGKNKYSNKILQKLESVIGSYDPNEEIKEYEYVLESTSGQEFEDTVALKRFKGNSCPTSSNYCRACWEKLKQHGNLSLPFSRAGCRLKHGWVQQGGLLFFKEEDGTLLSADYY